MLQDIRTFHLSPLQQGNVKKVRNCFGNGKTYEKLDLTANTLYVITIQTIFIKHMNFIGKGEPDETICRQQQNDVHVQDDAVYKKQHHPFLHAIVKKILFAKTGSLILRSRGNAAPFLFVF